MTRLPVNEAPNLIVIVEGTSLHHETTFHDPAGLRQRLANVIEKLRNAPELGNTDKESLEETIACLDAAREELATLSDARLVTVVDTCRGNTMPPAIKQFITAKRSRALTTIIQASLGLGL